MPPPISEKSGDSLERGDIAAFASVLARTRPERDDDLVTIS